MIYVKYVFDSSSWCIEVECEYVLCDSCSWCIDVCITAP